jgi:capsular polysaccharide biosynthesis protein
VTQLTQAASVAQSNYDQAASHLTDAGVGLSSVADSGVLRVFDSPRTTGLPVSRKKKLIFGGVAGLFAGAMVSLFILLFLVVGDRAVHGTGDLEDLLGMQVVGTIDQFKTKIRSGKSGS